mgnify:CR=1 FL=1
MSTLQKYYIAYDGSRTTDERSGCFDEVYYKAAEVEAVLRQINCEVTRIHSNGSPMTDFGRGVIAACKDIEIYLARLGGGR